MKSLSQQACDECCEMIKALEGLQWRVKEAKRLPSLEEIRIELSAVQMDFGAVKTQMSGMKAHVCAAFMTAGPPEAEKQSTRLIPRPARPVPMFPRHCEAT
jgi:hypothetical protein